MQKPRVRGHAETVALTALDDEWGRCLQGQLNEYTWRYNHRKDGRAMFQTLLLRAAAQQGVAVSRS